MNSSRIICIALALTVLVCMVSYAVSAAQVTVDANAATPTTGADPVNPCPIQRTWASMMSRIRGLTSSATSAASTTTATVTAPLSRRKRQTDAFGQPIDPQPPAALPANVQPVVPAIPQPTPQEVVAYDKNVQREESRLRSMINQLMSSQYMPSRDQVIQLLTTLLTLVLMMALGPVLGSNPIIVQTIVRQIVPFIVTAGVHYAADQAMPVKPIEAPITNVQLAPVQTAPSAFGQTF